MAILRSLDGKFFEVPDEELLWQDPLPAVDHELVDADDIASLENALRSLEGIPGRSWTGRSRTRRLKGTAASVSAQVSLFNRMAASSSSARPST